MAEAVRVKSSKQRAKKKNKHKVTEGTSDDSLHLPEPPSNIPGNADQERVESEDGENIKQDSELKEDEEVKMETGVEKEEGENDENIEERVGEDDPGGLEQEQEQEENIKTEVDEDEQCTKSDEAAEMKSLENKQSEIPEFPVEGISEGQEPSVHGGSEDQGSPVEGANEGEEFSGGGQGEIPELRQAEDELEHAEHDINDVKSTRDDETILEALNASQISSDFQSWDRVNERGETNSMIPDQPTAPPISMPATLTAVHQNTTTVETSPIKTFPEVGNETSRDIRERLYPEISSLAEDLDKLKPFTADELRLYYYNPQLQTLEDEVDRFIQDSYQERHEFYELVFHYYRSRHNLTAIEKDNKTLQREYKRQQDNLWIITNHVITAQGLCADRMKVSQSHGYKLIEYNQKTGNDVSRTLKHIRSNIHDTMSLCAYTTQLSRLQVESYIYDMFNKSPVLNELDSAAPVTAHLSPEIDPVATQDLQHLKQCISVLFAFYRRPLKDEEFIKYLQLWLERMVAALLRVACLNDHLFLMNHVIRCPAGISKWVTSFIQPVLPSSLIGATRGRCDWGGPLFDHFIAMLTCVMLPVKGREDFLSKMKVNLTPEPDSSQGFNWTLVDEDGEEDDDPVNSWMFLMENDLVSLLSQFHFGAMFKQVLLIDDTAETPYDIHRVTSHHIMRLFSFATTLVHQLGQGLKTFNRNRYRQFVKRIGRLIRHTVQYVAEHWLNYKKYRVETCHEKPDTIPQSDPYNKQHSLQRLQVEFDHFFLRAVQWILSAHRLGAWQFMTDIPYGSVSCRMMWRLLWMLHDGSLSEEYKDEDVDVTQQEYLTMVRDIDNRLAFEEKLVSMPTSEVIYLLTSFANMAKLRPCEEKAFIETITLEVYELAYVSSHTRDFCCKVGRELLSSIGHTHPFIMSTLLHKVKHSLDAVGMMSLYLFQELPVHVWKPTDDDMVLIREWLLDHALTTPQSQLARLVLTKMNWGFTHNEDALYLDLSLHRSIAILIVEVYAKFITEKGQSNLINDTWQHLTYLSSLAPGMRGGLTQEQQLSYWAWEMVLKLRLHKLEQPHLPMETHDYGSHEWSKDIPDMTSDPNLHPIQKGVKALGPLACYVAITMTKVGHSVDLFLADGINYHVNLVSTGYHKASIHVLSVIVPMFIQTPQYLLENEKFERIIQCIVHADRSVYGFTGKLIMQQVFPGDITKMFCSMIMHQLQCAGTPGGISRNDVLEFWFRALASVEYWTQDRDVQYLLDCLTRAAFMYKGSENLILEILFSMYKSLLGANKEQSVLSSLVSWISSSMPSLMEKPSQEFSWLAYAVLSIESRYEEDSQMRNVVYQLLSRDSKLTPDAALKKACSKLKLPYSPVAGRLSVYRWAYQALETDMDHPLLPAIWQQFFMVYLQRIVSEPGLPQRGSIGLRFFESLANSTLLKRCKKRLVCTADYHHNASKKAGSSSHHASTPDSDSDTNSQHASDGGSTNGRETPPLEQLKYQTSVEYHQCLVKLYQTFILWLDEPRLHEASLYLPALPPQYDADKLLRIFHSQQEIWTEFLDKDRVEFEVIQLVSSWVKECKVIHCSDQNRRHSLLTDYSTQSIESRILHRLKQYEPSKPPPSIVPLKSPVPAISDDLLNNSNRMVATLENDIRSLVEYARIFSVREANHIAIDCNYIEVLPDLYYNKPVELNLQVPCKSAYKLSHKCSGPAFLVLRFREMTKNSITARKLDANREEYEQVLQESMSPPPIAVCTAAVHIENAITALIKCIREKPLEEREKLPAFESGARLFYQLIAESDDDIRHYPPTKQFFSSCLEILGQEFILDTVDQSQPLLSAMLDKPVLAGLLAPNFNPNNCIEEFVDMYKQVTKLPHEKSDLAFMLLTKFDVARWLKEYKPILSLRSQLTDIIGLALCLCGQEPELQIQMLFEMYRSHLKLLLMNQFPDHYGDVLRLLLLGSEKGTMSCDCWTDFLESLGCTYNRQEGADSDQQRLQSLLHTQSLLTREQIKETIEWLTNYFKKLRVSTAELARFGLYSKWRPYIKPLSNFFGFLSQTYIVKEAERVISVGMGIEQVVEQLWKLISDLFTPWIVTMETLAATGRQLVAPWIESDSSSAIDMVALFTESIQCLQVQFQDVLPHYSHDALSLFWPYYVNVLSHKGIVEHVLRVCHARFVALPWNSFYPRLDAVELMLKLQDGSPTSCFIFLGSMFSQMNWVEITQHYMRNVSPDIATKLHVCLLLLLIMFSREKTIITTNTAMQALIKKSESFQWAYIDSSSYENVVQWLLSNTDPDTILSQRRCMEDKGLSLLRAAAGFAQNVPVNPDTPVKRCSYIRCVVQMICKCSHQKEIKVESFTTAIDDMMQDIESVASVAVDTQAMTSELIDLLTEVLNLLNNCASAGRGIEVVEKSLVRWIERSPCSVLILPLITAACRTLASLTHMVLIVETCMDSYFNSGMDLSQFGGWSHVTDKLQVPELTHDEFLDECMKQGTYLTLYAYILQRLPLCQSLNDELNILTKIVDWTTAAKPCDVNEAKLLLWWSKAIELCLRQVDYGAPHQYVIRTINNLAPALHVLGEDKTSAGLLGAIGLGRRSSLSLRFRLFCRSMVAFLLAQTPGDVFLRMQSHAPAAISKHQRAPLPNAPNVQPTVKAQQALANLESLQTNKQYSSLRETGYYASAFISDPANSLREANKLMSALASRLFPEKNYLAIIKV